MKRTKMKQGMTLNVIGYDARLLLLALCTMPSIPSCSPRIVETVRTEVEYRDRTVHDTTTVTIPTVVEKIITRDTVSHLENGYAKSDATVSGGLLSHSLESKPQVIKVPFEVHVTDTLWREQEVKTEIREVPAPLPWWQRVRIGAFWWLVLALVATNMKTILKWLTIR